MFDCFDEMNRIMRKHDSHNLLKQTAVTVAAEVIASLVVQYLFLSNLKFQAYRICACRFVSNLVGNHEDTVSLTTAQI